MAMISAQEAADAWGISKRRVLVFCKEGRIPGAQMLNNSMWLIPDDAEKPEDGRAFRYQKERITTMKIEPLKRSVKAEGHTPQYKMHKYFARRPYNVFSHIIKHYTSKGDVVLDSFCGGGVTVFESAALERNVIGVDLNPLATFITRMQMFNGDINELRDFYRRFMITINKKYSDWYAIKFDDDEGIAIWTEWAYTVKCPVCGEPIILNEQNKKSNGVYFCNNTFCSANKTGVKRVDCSPIGCEPIRAKYVSSKTGKTIVRNVDISNMPIFSTTNFSELINQLTYKPDFAIPSNWDRQHEDKLVEKGIINYKDFFTERNYVLNCLIFNEIMELRGTTNSKMNEYLYFLFSSSLRYTNKMTRVTENWENGNPTAMDKHAFWLPNQFVETNILDILAQRTKTILKGCDYSSSKLPKTLQEAFSFDDIKLHNSYMVLNRSSSDLPIPDKSVDIIITDPPYGSNVQYAELSTIWNAWFAVYNNLDSYIYKDAEAVVNRKQNYEGSKTVDDYEELLYQVYSEGARVLKPNGYLVFTFNNKNIKVWIAMLKAVSCAGFYLPDDGILFQDYIDSYKNTAHLRFSGNIQGDFIYSFKKGQIDVNPKDGMTFSGIIDNAIDTTVSRLFKRKKTYSTPDLYQRILTAMTRDLMEYIMWCTTNNIPMESVSSFSNDYLENKLKNVLVCEDGIWKKV